MNKQAFEDVLYAKVAEIAFEDEMEKIAAGKSMVLPLLALGAGGVGGAYLSDPEGFRKAVNSVGDAGARGMEWMRNLPEHIDEARKVVGDSIGNVGDSVAGRSSIERAGKDLKDSVGAIGDFGVESYDAFLNLAREAGNSLKNTGKDIGRVVKNIAKDTTPPIYWDAIKKYVEVNKESFDNWNETVGRAYSNK